MTVTVGGGDGLRVSSMVAVRCGCGWPATTSVDGFAADAAGLRVEWAEWKQLATMTIVNANIVGVVADFIVKADRGASLSASSK